MSNFEQQKTKFRTQAGFIAALDQSGGSTPKALKLYEKQYGDFGPTLAAEKLAERHGMAVNAETLRGWLLAKGVTHFQRRKRPHRAWRG